MAFRRLLSTVSAFFAIVTASETSLPAEADWIIVGGGAAGCCAAAALADANENVIVIERGPDDRSIASSQSGTSWPKVVVDAVENIRWTEGAWGAVARILGGGASVNDGYFFEEEPNFIGKVLQLGQQDVLDFFASSKYLAQQLTTPLLPTDYGKAYAQSLELAGHGKANFQDTSNIRYKDGQWVVRSLFNVSEPKQSRQTPAVLLHKRSHMPNLKVATDTHVLKINFDKNRAVGIMVQGGSSIKARKGVIMAAGAIYTPQLLQISGVGDAALLSRLGVEQVVDLPGVGQNFVDRLTWALQIAAARQIPHYVGYTVAADSTAGITFESVGGKGVDSQLAIPSLGLAPAKQRSELLRPIMKLLMDGPIGNIVDQMSNLVGFVQDTESRGSIEALSKESSVPPRVSANFFHAAGDLDKLVNVFHELVYVAKESPVEPWRTSKAFEPPNATLLEKVHVDILSDLGIDVKEQGIPDFLSCLFRQPGEQIPFITLPCPPEDASKWSDFVHDNVLSTYHYFGTAAVGSVIERGSFKVIGTDGLYVVDASAIPRATRINPVGTIMTIGHFVGSKLGKEARATVLV